VVLSELRKTVSQAGVPVEVGRGLKVVLVVVKV